MEGLKNERNGAEISELRAGYKADLSSERNSGTAQVLQFREKY